MLKLKSLMVAIPKNYEGSRKQEKEETEGGKERQEEISKKKQLLKLTISKLLKGLWKLCVSRTPINI